MDDAAGKEKAAGQVKMAAAGQSRGDLRQEDDDESEEEFIDYQVLSKL